MTASVSLVGVTKRFGDFTAVDDVSLEVQPGEFFGLLGPNGAGKSTTIKMIMGLARPTAGTIEVLGHDVAREALKVKGQVGLLGEELAVFERLTGQEFLYFAGRMYGLDEETVQQRAGELLGLLDMDEDRDRSILDYSYGMKKKIGLAAALIHNPRVLFLDEPFNGVDAVSARKVRGIFEELTARGITVFFSSHVMEVVERLCTRFAIMSEGRIVAMGSLDELRRELGQDLEALEDVFLRAVGADGRGGGLSWLG